jgi:hypothetical protein
MRRYGLRAILLEAGRYLAGSENSRLRQLRAMRQLDARLLEDIGLTPADARRGHPLRSRSGDAEPPSIEAAHAARHVRWRTNAKG